MVSTVECKVMIVGGQSAHSCVGQFVEIVVQNYIIPLASSTVHDAAYLLIFSRGTCKELGSRNKEGNLSRIAWALGQPGGGQ
eukprot:1176956-Prorocentrum_minimum.AAC.4